MVTIAALVFATCQAPAPLRVAEFITHAHHHRHAEHGVHHHEGARSSVAHDHRHHHEVPTVFSVRTSYDLTTLIVPVNRIPNAGDTSRSGLPLKATPDTLREGLTERIPSDRGPPLPDDSFYTRGSPRSPPRMA